MNDTSAEFIATDVTFNDGMVELRLIDGSRHALPLHYYPRHCSALLAQLLNVRLRVSGRSLRWEDLDEDKWIANAILDKYPNPRHLSVAESPLPHYLNS